MPTSTFSGHFWIFESPWAMFIMKILRSRKIHTIIHPNTSYIIRVDARNTCTIIWFKSGCAFNTSCLFVLQNFVPQILRTGKPKQIPFASCPGDFLSLQAVTQSSSLGNWGVGILPNDPMDHFEDRFILRIIRISSHLSQPESINACMTLTLTIPHNWMDS